MNDIKVDQPVHVDRPTHGDGQIVHEVDGGTAEKKKCIACGADQRDDGSLPCDH